MSKLSGLLVFVCAAAVLSAGVQGAVVHRYAFVNDANDLVGNADGTLINNTGRATIAGGRLSFGNQGSEYSQDVPLLGDYVNLPNGTVSALGGQITFEIWATWRGPVDQSWQRFFDFGISNDGEDVSVGGANSTYVFLTPRSDANTIRFGYRLGSTATERWVQTGTAAPIGSEVCVAVAWDEAAGKVRLYVNGAFVQENDVHFSIPAQMNDVNNWLSRSQWPDPLLNGSVNEFRLYNHAFSGGEAAASYAAGTEISPANPVSPIGGEKDVPLQTTLVWAPGILPAGTSAPVYTLYFGNNQGAVEARDVSTRVDDFTETSLALAAELQTDQTYYWVVDETVTQPGMTEPNVIAGGVVSFETPKTFPVLTAPASTYGLIGESATITVDIVTASDVVACSWYKYVDGINDTELTAGTKYGIGLSNEEATLTIADVAEDDAGAYYCEVENAAGPKASSNVTLYVRRGLVHRYSFDGTSAKDPNVIDSVGGMHGRVVVRTPDLNTRYENGMLILGNTGQLSDSGTGDYVDLPNGMISALGNLATFEMWISWRGPVGNNWQRIFDFGTSNAGENSSGGAGDSYYVMLTPRGGASLLRTGYMKGREPTVPPAERVVDDPAGQVLMNRLTHIAVVWDGDAGQVRLYRDGRRVGQNALHFALRDMPDNNNWLGRAQWNDPLFRGSYDEFRIYDVPLDDATIRAHYNSGPDEILPCMNPPAGDVNGDCQVDLRDLAIVADTWLVCGGPVCE